MSPATDQKQSVRDGILKIAGFQQVLDEVKEQKSRDTAQYRIMPPR